MLIRHSAVNIQGFIWVENGLVCGCETVEKIGQVDEMGERELVLVVSVQCGMERHDTWMTCSSRTPRCAILSLPALEPRVMNVIMLYNSVRAVFVGVLFTEREVEIHDLP